MLLHHFGNKRLDGKPVNTTLLPFSEPVSDRTYTEILGSSIAYLTRSVLAARIGVSFIQVYGCA